MAVTSSLSCKPSTAYQADFGRQELSGGGEHWRVLPHWVLCGPELLQMEIPGTWQNEAWDWGHLLGQASWGNRLVQMLRGCSLLL